METQLIDFKGEIEWMVCGESLFLDKTNQGMNDLLSDASLDVEELAITVQGMEIDENRQRPMLQRLLEKVSTRYEQLYIADAGGDYFNADGNRNNILDRQYYNLVMRGHTVISQPIVNRSTGRPVVAVATPIWNQGKLIGLFGATILLTFDWSGLRFLPFSSRGRVLHYRERRGVKGTGRRAKAVNL